MKATPLLYHAAFSSLKGLLRYETCWNCFRCGAILLFQWDKKEVRQVKWFRRHRQVWKESLEVQILKDNLVLIWEQVNKTEKLHKSFCFCWEIPSYIYCIKTYRHTEKEYCLWQCINHVAWASNHLKCDGSETENSVTYCYMSAQLPTVLWS